MSHKSTSCWAASASGEHELGSDQEPCHFKGYLVIQGVPVPCRFKGYIASRGNHLPRDKTNRSSVSTMPYVCILVCVQVSPVAQQCVCGKLGTRFLLQFHRRFCCSLSHIGMAFLVERDTFLDFAKPSLDPRRTGSFPPRRRKAEHEHQLEPLSPRQVKLQELVPTGTARFSVFIGRGDKGNAATKLFPEMDMPCNTFVIDHFATSMGMTVGKFMNLY